MFNIVPYLFKYGPALMDTLDGAIKIDDHDHQIVTMDSIPSFKETAMDLDALAFGAHADDVEITCGGTIIKLAALGYKTGVIALTRGEMATRGTPEIRAEEFRKSAEIMGLAAHKMLDIPDGRVEVTWENKLKIIAVIRAHRPRIILAPYWVERHPDHEQDVASRSRIGLPCGFGENRDGTGCPSGRSGSFITRAATNSRLRSSSTSPTSTTGR